MNNLVRRPSGYYALRLAVPRDLRACLNKSEIIESTGTRELALAKIVASTAGARWRERFIELRRLKTVASIDAMSPEDLLRLTSGSPTLHGVSHLPLGAAARASGISEDDLLRMASEGRLGLWCRTTRCQGHLVPEHSLELNDPALGRAGGFAVPNPRQMPGSAAEHVAEGMLEIARDDCSSIVASLLTDDQTATCVAFPAPGQPHRPGWWFIPNTPVAITRASIEVSASQVETLRRQLAQLVPADQVTHAREVQKAAQAAPAPKKNKHADKPLSEALEHYIKNKLHHTHQNLGEITRIGNGCRLLIELEGDVALGSVTTEQLRDFRDTKLSRVPAQENKVRLQHGTSSVAESMAAVAGTDWPVMSAGEREKRMRWIGAWFHWLHGQRWLDENPAAPLHGESVMSVTERKKKVSRRADEVRHAFSREDLHRLFTVEWFRTGRGELTKAGTYREFMPHYYWAPLIALLAGGARVNEVAQLHLSDFGVTAAGTAYVDFQDEGDDQKIKNEQSKRRVPLHPLLIDLGLLAWVDALKSAGHDRLFPELRHDAEKGYGKAVTKWFGRLMARLGYPREGTLTFHSFRHTFTNALPEDTPERVRKQFTGHVRGNDAHDTVYRKDLAPDEALPFIKRLRVDLPPGIARFDIPAGLKSVGDALTRKSAHRAG